MAAPSYANPNEHRAPMKSPSECGRNFAPLWGWKLGDTEALREERQLGRHAGYALRVDLLTNKALSWKLPGGSGQRYLDSRASVRAIQEPPKAQPAGSAAGPGVRPGLQRVVRRPVLAFGRDGLAPRSISAQNCPCGTPSPRAI